MADTSIDLQMLLEALRSEGVAKLAWAITSETHDGHERWNYEMQASNEMGAPVALTAEAEDLLREVVAAGALGPRAEGTSILDVDVGTISGPEPHLAEGAGAPGLFDPAASDAPSHD